jgi:hypothetical protein
MTAVPTEEVAIVPIPIEINDDLVMTDNIFPEKN